MLEPFYNYIRQRLEERKKKAHYRQLTLSDNLSDFCSNDYLGFRDHPDLLAETNSLFASLQIKEKHIQGSRLLCGNSSGYEELENELAKKWSAEAGLLFPSGYMANLSLLSSLPYRGDTILFDEAIHASCRDGIRASKAESISFSHQQPEDLEKKLSQAKGLKYVVVESIYSMNGGLTPLKTIAGLCQKYQAALIVDEAHAGGIFGEQGGGLTDSPELAHLCMARIITFGKAFGSQGAIILGNQEVKDFLINFARPLIYSTAMGMYERSRILAVTRADNLRLDRINILNENIHIFHSGIRGYENLEITDTPIQILRIRGAEAVRRAAAGLRAAGIDARPIVSPTVPPGEECIRFIIHAHNSPSEIKNLCQQLSVYLK